jgi:hypothetical protein
MVYALDAVVGDAAVLREHAAGLDDVVIVPLCQGLALVPVTDPAFVALTGSPPGRRAEPSGEDPFALVMAPAFARILAGWSGRAPLAFVEADFWAGDGNQSAVVWRQGRRAWGPAYDRDFDGPREGWPINAALAELGAQPRSSVRLRCGHDPAPPVDLFAAVGLGRHRDNDEWARNAECAEPLPEMCQECERMEEQLARIPLELDGRVIMDLLGIPAGPLVGAALRHLRQRSMALGPMSRAQAEAELHRWTRERALSG